MLHNGQAPADFVPVTGLERKPQRCTLCEQEFAKLEGVTYLKAVAEKRDSWGDDSLRLFCSKRGFHMMYEPAKLCTFCCQFFLDDP